MQTTNRCNLCGGLGQHMAGCSNRQGSGFTQSVYSYGADGDQEMYRSFVETREMRVMPFKNLIEAAEEMYGRFGSSSPEWPEWKAAIDAARIELERGKR